MHFPLEILIEWVWNVAKNLFLADILGSSHKGSLGNTAVDYHAGTLQISYYLILSHLQCFAN